MKPNTWMNDPQYLAQVGHFLGGACLVMLVAIFAGVRAVPLALALGVGAAALKEFWYYDLPTQTWKDSGQDFLFYVLGGGVGAALAALAHHLGRIA